MKATVDGAVHELGELDPGLPVASWLRDSLGLSSVKIGCAEGSCGACVALVDGRALPTCLLPVARIAGSDVVTATVVTAAGRGAVLARWLVAEGGLQCGYCTPGVVCAAVALLDAQPPPDGAAIRAALAGHLCRCTGYAGIVRAVEGAIREVAA